MGLFTEFYRRYQRKSAAYDREAGVRESQARLATFAAASFEGIAESEAGRILDCNEQLARMLGYSVSELKGKEIADLVGVEDRDGVMANIREGRESVIEHVMLRQDGRRIMVEAHGRCVSPGARGKVHRDTAGRAVRMTGVCWDITTHKEAEAELRRRAEELRTANQESALFNQAMVGRELRMIELKQEVNDLCTQAGQPPRYGPLADEQAPPAS